MTQGLKYSTGKGGSKAAARPGSHSIGFQRAFIPPPVREDACRA